MMTDIFVAIMYLAPVVGLLLIALMAGALAYLAFLEVREWSQARSEAIAADRAPEGLSADMAA